MNKDKLKGKTMTDQLATLTQDGDVSIITLNDVKLWQKGMKRSIFIISLKNLPV